MVLLPRIAISWRRRRANRADIPAPHLEAGANGRESGRTVQTRLEEIDLKR